MSRRYVHHNGPEDPEEEENTTDMDHESGGSHTKRLTAITLPTLPLTYGGKPVRYENHKLYVGDEVVRQRASYSY